MDINLILLKFYDIKEFNKHIRLHALFGLVIFFLRSQCIRCLFHDGVDMRLFITIPLEDVLVSSHPWTLISSNNLHEAGKVDAKELNFVFLSRHFALVLILSETVVGVFQSRTWIFPQNVYDFHNLAVDNSYSHRFQLGEVVSF